MQSNSKLILQMETIVIADKKSEIFFKGDMLLKVPEICFGLINSKT